MKTIKEFQEVIGYEFKNESLLRQALTHSSYANEKHMKKLSGTAKSLHTMQNSTTTMSISRSPLPPIAEKMAEKN